MISTILEFCSITNIHYVDAMFVINVYLVFPLFIVDDFRFIEEIRESKTVFKIAQSFYRKNKTFREKMQSDS